MAQWEFDPSIDKRERKLRNKSNKKMSVEKKETTKRPRKK